MKKNYKEIFDQMKIAGALAAETLDEITKYIEPGISTNQLDKIVAVGRMHILEDSNNEIAQIRYMAVDDEFQKKGLGRNILESFEIIAKEKIVKKIILHARENAIGFYKQNGYKIKKKSHLLHNQIQHWLMYKNL